MLPEEDYYSSPDLYEELHIQETVYDVWENCVLESLKSLFPLLVRLIVSNLLFGFIAATGLLSDTWFHILSGCTGAYLLSSLEKLEAKWVLTACFMLGYVLIAINRLVHKYARKDYSHVTKIILICALVLSEYSLLQPDVWIQIRGIVMILSMKVISICDDFPKSRKPLGLVHYFGYALCGANVLFGPWISYHDYYSLYLNTTRKSPWWIVHVVRAISVSLFFLTISNCWTTFLIPDDYNKWLVAYREALSFRTSHYFICYLSEASMLAAGFKDSQVWYDVKKWTFTVSHPLEIEFPSALASVVTNWNRPMHEFLKKYVYRSWLPYGQFIAIFVTFVFSSFLHGFEAKVSVVLITIGIFSYLQMMPRKIVADVLGCCVCVKPCKSCNHTYKRNHFKTRLINLVYTLFTILHLAYLGVLMDPSTDEIGIYQKWHNLYFTSHFIMIVNLLIII